MTVRPAKTQISLGIRPVWSEPSPCAQWVAWKPSFLRTTETLIRLGGCPGWSESSLGAQSLCWFCHEAAHMNIEHVIDQVLFTVVDTWPALSCLLLQLTDLGANCRSFADHCIKTKLLLYLYPSIMKLMQMGTKRLKHLSRLMTKPTKQLCAQRRLSSAWVSTQSHQSFRCALSG